MRPHTETLTLAAADADAIAADQAGVGNAALTIIGTTATLDPPQHVGITSAGNDAAISFLVTGTDRNGEALTETITGGNATLASGVENFATVSSVVPSGNTTGNVTAGTVAACESAWWPAPRHETPVSIAIAGDVTSGTPTWGAQFTLANVQANGFQESDAKAFDNATVTNKTADFSGSQDTPCRALRIEMSGAGTLEFTFLAAGR